MINRTTTQLDEPDPAECFDSALRWLIPSRTNPNEHYLVELNDAPGYDVCQCKWFVTTLGPILKLGISPEQAVAEKLVKIKKHERISDALKCWHIREGNYRFGIAWKRFHCRRRRAEETQQKNRLRHAPTQDSPSPEEPPPIRRSDLRAQAEDLGPSPRLD